MSRKQGKPTHEKIMRERLKREKQRSKAEKRTLRKARKKEDAENNVTSESDNSDIVSAESLSAPIGD